jgi:nicotinamide-nucleotide amidase
MNAHIITIGDEILIGQTLNTNAAYIGTEISKLQINVQKASVVGDDENAILKEFQECWERNNLLIVTGGLGPTNDDITRQCVVKFFNTELINSKEVLDDIKNLFKKRGRELTKVNENQALVPKIAEVIRNERGTAPGYWIEIEGKIFIAMPGVPFEMATMMKSFVIPNLRDRIHNLSSFTIRRTLQTTGIPESNLYERLGNLDELLDGSKLAFLPSQFGVKLRITVEEKDEEAAKNKISEVEQKIRSKAGRYIYACEDETLEGQGINNCSCGIMHRRTCIKSPDKHKRKQ